MKNPVTFELEIKIGRGKWEVVDFYRLLDLSQKPHRFSGILKGWIKKHDLNQKEKKYRVFMRVMSHPYYVN